MGKSGRYNHHGKQNEGRRAEDQHQPAHGEKQSVGVSKSSPIHITTDDEDWRAEQRQQWKRQETLQYRLNWITGIAAVGGIAGLIVLYFTLTATQQSADTASRNLQVSERAWVFFDPKILEAPKIGTTPNVEFMVHNTGKLPATILDHAICFAPLTLDDHQPMPKCRGERAPPWSVIFPDTPGSITGSISAHLTRALTEEDFVGFSQSEYLYLWGEINYTDALHNQHVTRQCYRYSPNKRSNLISPATFVSCPQPGSQSAE